MSKTYPDISKILAAKAARRRALAALSWEEKIAIVERMRRLLPRGRWREKPADEKTPGALPDQETGAQSDGPGGEAPGL